MRIAVIAMLPLAMITDPLPVTAFSACAIHFVLVIAFTARTQRRLLTALPIAVASGVAFVDGTALWFHLERQVYANLTCALGLAAAVVAWSFGRRRRVGLAAGCCQRRGPGRSGLPLHHVLQLVSGLVLHSWLCCTCVRHCLDGEPRNLTKSCQPLASYRSELKSVLRQWL